MKHSFFSSLFLFSISLLFLLSSCEKEETPVVPKNHEPKIENLTASSTRLLINSGTTLTCIATDEDKDSLTITWSSRRGTFSNGGAGISVKWISPSTAGTDTIIAIVSDGKATVRGEIVLIVGTLPHKPVLLMPENNSSEIPLTTNLKWGPGKDAQSYTLQVSTDKLFSDFMINRSGLKSRSKQITELKSNTVYFWRVHSKNLFGYSRWSDVFSFKTVSPPTTPELISPTDLEKDISLSPTLSWQKIENADSYSMQISSDKKFSNLIFNQQGLKETSQLISGLNYFSTYYWRVKATNAYGTSDWSNVWSYSTTGIPPAKPVLITPTSGTMNSPISTQVNWSESIHASSYNLQVSEDSSFASLTLNQNEIAATNWIIIGLTNWTKYYWRVSSINNYGRSDWSETWSFSTIISVPAQMNPLNDVTGISITPTLNWDTVNGASSYTLQVSSDSAFSNIVFSKSDISTTSQEVSDLNSFTKYYWRVLAENDFGSSGWSNIWAFTVTAYFYKALPYGTQAVYNPIYVLLNGGFDMIQVGNQRDIKKFPYKIALKNIWQNLSDPITPINNYGWWNFIKDQVLPLSLTKDNAQFWPNYSLHLIGGGMEYAALKEWYEYYKYPYPQLFSAFTIMSYHFVNEVVENGTHVGDDVDPIADIYLFDIGGILLFTSDNVKRFFAEELNLADWSQQPSFSLKDGTLHNNGQFFSVKWKLPFLDSWHAFYYFGTNGVGGLSYKFENGSALSVGLGLAAGDLILLNEKTNKKTIGLVGNLGIFYDRNNSLLASLSLTIKTDYMLNINIYPGVVKLWGISPGLWGAYSQDGNVILGFTAMWSPFGLGYSTK